jgi:hypothetical protein
MKKAIMFIALVATSMVGANAQKFQGGEKNLEVNFSPLSASPIGINGIRFRMFNSESSAIRVGFNVNGGNNTSVIQQPYEVQTGAAAADVISKSELYAVTKDFSFSIRPGYEKHFAGTDRLSPYVGAELVFEMNSSSYSEEYHSGNTDNNKLQPQAAQWSTWTIERKEGNRTFGLNAVAGADFYFADNFYLGAEISLGFHSSKWKDSEISVSDEAAYLKYNDTPGLTGQRAIAATFDDMLDESADGKSLKIRDRIGGKSSDWGPDAQATLRLGWLF